MEREVRNYMATFLRAQIMLGIVICFVMCIRVIILIHNNDDHDPITLSITIFLIAFLIVCDRITTLWMLNRKIRRAESDSVRLMMKRKQNDL